MNRSFFWLAMILSAWVFEIEAKVYELPTYRVVQAQYTESYENKWVTELTNANYNLIAGNKYAFQESLSKLEESGSFGMLLKLYSLATETDMAVVDATKYRDSLRAYENSLRRRPVGILDHSGNPPSNYDDDQSRWHRANYHFLSQDSTSLNELLEINWESDTDSSFVSGFIHLLLARLDKSTEHAELAVSLLSSVDGGVDKTSEFTQRQGRIALYLGRAYLILDRLSDGEDPNNLELANRYASIARYGLELHELPLMYGRALELTADVLERLAQIEKFKHVSGYSVAIDMMLEVDRLREVAAIYH